MTQVFLSYASADRDRAGRLATAMQRCGYQVWWDRQIAPGQVFDEVIERALTESACVVVLWSSTSITSQWVKTEAAEAASRRILVPARIDDVKIPLEFRRLQAADLTKWTGQIDDPEFRQFLRAVDEEIHEHRELAWSEAPTTLGGPASTPAKASATASGSIPERARSASQRAPAQSDPREADVSVPSRAPAGRRWAWVLALVSAAVLIGVPIAWVSRDTDQQTPNVVGMPYERAVAALTAIALSPERRDRPSNTDIPGVIIAQSPSAGTTLAGGGTVTLTVAVPIPVASTTAEDVPASTGVPALDAPPSVEPAVTVPDLRGLTPEAATALVAAAGLNIGRATEVSANDVVLGTIVGQDPIASEAIAKGSSVQITVAARRTTPELAGLSQSQARDVLMKLGLQPRVELVRAGRGDGDDRVVRQVPAPASDIDAGGEVTLTVAIVTPKRVNGGESLFRTDGRRCAQVCTDIGLTWTRQWSGDTNTCTCDLK